LQGENIPHLPEEREKNKNKKKRACQRKLFRKKELRTDYLITSLGNAAKFANSSGRKGRQGERRREEGGIGKTRSSGQGSLKGHFRRKARVNIVRVFLKEGKA